ncbi:MAG: alpha/beta fold hydrolase [Pseudomonadota bacterium]
MRAAKAMQLSIHSGRIATWYFPPLGSRRLGTVLVTHGWGARTEYMLEIISALQKDGHAVVALDLPGHGGSSGRTLDMARAVEAVDAAWRQYGPFSMMVGHSFGGAVVLNAAVASVEGFRANSPDKLALISAPNSLPAVFEWFADLLGLRPKSRRALYDGVAEVTGRPLETFIGTVQLAVFGKPTLVIHAPDDREITADSARAFQTAGDHVQLCWADGLGHRRILRSADVAERLCAFARAGDRAAAA